MIFKRVGRISIGNGYMRARISSIHVRQGKKNPTLNMWSKKGRVIKNMLLTNKFSQRGMCLLGENRVKLKSGLCALAKIK